MFGGFKRKVKVPTETAKVISGNFSADFAAESK
jgi:hypothetical protein